MHGARSIFEVAHEALSGELSGVISKAMTRTRLIPVVLAGGSGTRLWPLSREEHPKQLLRLQAGGTLLQETVTRVDGLAAIAQGLEVEAPIVVCNEEHRFLICEQLDEVSKAPQCVLLEPVGRNTAPALTLAALFAHTGDADPLLLVLPSDHVIADASAFHAAIASAAQAADDGGIVTFGVVPNRAEIGYGYIKTGTRDGVGLPPVHDIEAFVEKPDAATAERYLASGQYLWNGGMFLMRASVWLDALSRFAPDIAQACDLAMRSSSVDGSFVRPDADAFGASPSDSIDYAVMERLRTGAEVDDNGPTGAVVSLDAGWSDVGSWLALLELDANSEDGNVVSGDVFTYETTGTLVVSQSRLVATVGIDNAIVVETPDAVLVAHKDRCQDVREVVSWLNQSERPEGRSHRRVYRPWGAYEQLDVGDAYQVKRLTVKPGASLSLQLHHHRAEHWIVVRGTAKVTCGEESFLLSENSSTYIPLGTKHRLENPGTITLEVIEVQSGSYLGEDDIVRFEDIYNRVE